MAEVLDTLRAVGHIAQVQHASDGTWVSWTQYTKGTPDENRANARTHVQRLLETKGFSRGRVVRADWVVEEIIDPVATETPGEEAGGDRENLGLEATENERG